MTPKLTVDLGLRWEYYTPFIGIADQGGLSNYNPTNNTVEVAGYGSIPQNIGVKSNFGNFAPRLGASYRFDEKTVLRAGFGTTIVPFPDNRYAYNFPVKQTEQFNAPNSYAPAGSMATGFGAPTIFPVPDSGVIDANIPQLKNAQLFYVQSDLKEAKLHSWNVALQRQLPWDLVGEVAYVGNVGRGIVIADYNMNAGMVLGADNAGRPYYQLYGRTANVLRLPAHGHVLQLDAGQARSPLQERLPGDHVLHAEQGHQLHGGDRHRDAGRPRAEQGPAELRPHPRVRLELHLRHAVLQGEQRRPALGARRLAALGHLRRLLGHADQLHRQRRRRWQRPATRSART